MIPIKQDNGSLLDHMPGEQHEMKLDLSAMNHIMRILTDLYSDPEESILREYSVNGLDSNIMAGVDAPVEISLPTPLRQTLEIKDSGLGLSKEDIIDVYGTYGASTKRESNDVTGSLGMGSKSALTYTNMFSVRGVKDGKLTVVQFSRNPDKAGQIKIVAESDTDEPNGVTVVVPVAKYNNFESKAKKIFKYWKPGTVVIDGIAPHNVYEHGLKIDDDNYIVPDEDKDVIVMGSVAYPHYENSDYRKRYSIVHFAPMGSVEFTPSREELVMSDYTKDYLAKIADTISVNRVHELIQELIEAEPTAEAAVEVWKKYGRLHYSFKNFFYKGHELTSSLEHPHDFFLTEGNVGYSYYSRAPKRFFKDEQRLNVEAVNGIFIADRPRDEVLSSKKRKQIDKYMSEKGRTGNAFFCEKPDHILFEDSVEVAWQDILDVEIEKVKRAPRGTVSKYPSYEYMINGNRTYGILPKSTDLIYNVGKESWRPASKVSTDNPDIIFVALTEKRKNRFLKLYPNASTWTDYKSKLGDTFEELTDVEILYSNIGWYNKEFLKDLKGLTDDPMIDALNDVDTTRIAEVVASWYNMKTIDEKDDYIDSNYPLANRYNKEHSIIYINAVVNDRKKKA